MTVERYYELAVFIITMGCVLVPVAMIVSIILKYRGKK